MKWIALSFLYFYKYAISPLLSVAFAPSCRFSPTCSEYAIDAVKKYGFIKGVWLGVKRILRCHPFSAGGYDPVH